MCSHSKRDGREYYLLTAVAALFGGVTVISFIYSSYFVVAIRTEPSDSYLRTAFTFELFVVRGKAHRTDEVQPRAGGGAGARDISGILGNFRLYHNNVDFRHIVNLLYNTHLRGCKAHRDNCFQAVRVASSL